MLIIATIITATTIIMAMQLITIVIIIITIIETTRTIHSLVIWNSLTAGKSVRVSLR